MLALEKGLVTVKLGSGARGPSFLAGDTTGNSSGAFTETVAPGNRFYRVSK